VIFGTASLARVASSGAVCWKGVEMTSAVGVAVKSDEFAVPTAPKIARQMSLGTAPAPRA